jgi:hypothetical protein
LVAWDTYGNLKKLEARRWNESKMRVRAGMEQKVVFVIALRELLLAVSWSLDSILDTRFGDWKLSCSCILYILYCIII